MEVHTRAKQMLGLMIKLQSEHATAHPSPEIRPIK